MQIVEIIAVAGLGILFLLMARVLVQTRGSAAVSPRGPQTSAMQTYLALRHQALQGSRKASGLAAPSTLAEPWGVVMDMALGNGSATVAALSDGSASIYLSGGGGFIGGRSQQPVRDAAKKTVEEAKKCRPLMRATTSFPLPEKSEVAFYLLTDAGIFAAIASEELVGTPSHPFARLYAAAQDVITQYRLSQQPE
ncbi:MAG: hypothetical protein LAO03_02130 [Acidobacteriia bacterium]|nr:hypothetical protein [Terriglobia bacterium]